MVDVSRLRQNVDELASLAGQRRMVRAGHRLLEQAAVRALDL